MMESVFCFEIAVDVLTLKKRVQCEIPYIAVAFLDYPTIVIHSDNSRKLQSQENVYQFQKGKSCLFKISPTRLYEQLRSTEIYLIVLDKSSEKKCIGSSSFSLKQTVKEIIGDLQTNGIHRTTCHGATGKITLTNFMHATVGHVDITYKLTSLGHSIIPHLSAVALSEKEPPLVRIENCEKPDTMPEDNVFCPPALFYAAEREEGKESPNKPERENILKVDQTNQKSLNPTRDSDKKTKNPNKKLKTAEVEERRFLSVNITGDQKCEATQTDAKNLEQYPVLQALVKEVLELGFDQPTSAPEVYPPQQLSQQLKNVEGAQNRPISIGYSKGRPKPVALSARKKGSTTRMTEKKPLQYPLQYGMTKSMRLRMELNQKQEKEAKLSPKQRRKKKITSKKVPISKKQATVKKHVEAPLDSQSITPENSVSEEFVSEQLSIDDFKHTTTEDVITVLDPPSPRALSRQSIEIRLPTATSSYNDDDQPIETSEKYKYSDDFDDDQMSFERSTSALTNLESSPQNTGVDLSTDFAAHDSPHRLSLEVSPQPTTSDVSLSPTLGATYLKKVSDDEKFEEESIEVSPKSSGNLESPNSWKYSLPRSAITEESESKHTDTSSSVATAMMTPMLPIPQPSDSPVIRSLASEPTSRSRNPHPPSMSHSSSYERIRRKFKRSSDSFHISDISDVRTSDLVDIKTSDISEFRSSDELSTRLATQRYNASPPK